MTAFSKCIQTLIQILEVLRHFFYFWWSLSAVASLAFQMYRARLKGGPQFAWTLQADQAEVISNSRNKVHQTWGPPFGQALYMSLLDWSVSITAIDRRLLWNMQSRLRRFDKSVRGPRVVYPVIRGDFREILEHSSYLLHLSKWKQRTLNSELEPLGDHCPHDKIVKGHRGYTPGLSSRSAQM